MKVYLCGMIGSGKTTLGERLAREFDWEFLDLDREMNRRLGYPFARLVEEKGWVAFRELEYSICKDFVGRREDAIVALGGGTVRYEWNRDLIRGTGLTVVLTAPEEVLVERVRLADRPRVNPNTTLEEDVRRLWAEHKHKYLQAADLVYDTSGRTVDEAVNDLKEIVVAKAGAGKGPGKG